MKIDFDEETDSAYLSLDESKIVDSKENSKVFRILIHVLKRLLLSATRTTPVLFAF